MQHSFDVDIAKEYGVHCAIIMNHLEFWIAKNEANGQNFYDGRYWTFNSAEAFSKLFPYMSARQVNYALQKLRDAGILMTGNFNASAYDRTLWYAFTDFGISIIQNREIHFTKLSNENDGIVQPIPDINPDINPDSKPDGDIAPSAPATGSRTSSPPVRHKYGRYKNVLLSDKDMEKLKAEFPGDYEERIERLSEYIASKGEKYKNHLATIRNWARRDEREGGKRSAKRGGSIGGAHGAIEESGAYGKFL